MKWKGTDCLSASEKGKNPWTPGWSLCQWGPCCTVHGAAGGRLCPLRARHLPPDHCPSPAPFSQPQSPRLKTGSLCVHPSPDCPGLSAALRGWAHSTWSPCNTGSTSEKPRTLPPPASVSTHPHPRCAGTHSVPARSWRVGASTLLPLPVLGT